MTVTIGDAPRRTGPLSALRPVWSAGTWLATTHLMVGLVLGLLSVGVFVVAVPFSGGLLLWPATAVLTRWQRARFAAYLGVAIQRRRPPPYPIWSPRRWWAVLTGGAFWRAVGYHVLAAVIGPLSAVVVALVWSAGIGCTTVALHARLLPDWSIAAAQLHKPPVLVAVTAAGVLLLLVAPWVARGAAALDALVARALLEPRSHAELSRQVESLAHSRAELVDAVDSERRRIERDLHDGAQQRLVSLAMNLGMARANLTDLPDPARAALVDAHEEAKQALAELRGFVRGLHPAVLDDLGLDAALSGLTARCAVPVRLTVDLPQRPSATIEAVAYFVVSEALANTARHSGATRAEVTVDQPRPGRMRVRVADNGRGGARIDGGTGIRGLVQRVGSVDGTLSVASPSGGPTVILVELPCES